MSEETADRAAPASPITPARVASAMAGVGEPRLFESALYWVENRPAEGGRVTLLKAEGESTRELTPAPCNVRSRVHEYGGAAYLPTRDAVYFVNAGDLHAIDGGAAIRPITDSGPGITVCRPLLPTPAVGGSSP